MNIQVHTQSGWVTICPDKMQPVCPLIFAYPDHTHTAKAAARRYLNGEGWIELAENRLDPWPDKETVDFIESV